jgi:hypothetical protein
MGSYIERELGVQTSGPPAIKGLRLLNSNRRDLPAPFYHLTSTLTSTITEFELIQTQMAQKPMLRAEVYAHALRASQKRERERMYGWARDAPDELAGRGRVREWKALVRGWRDL